MLKYFTDVSLDEIDAIDISNTNSIVDAKLLLASTVTRMLRGEEGLSRALTASKVLYGGSIEGLDAKTIKAICKDVPSTKLKREYVVNKSILDIALVAKVTQSKAETRRLVASGGLYFNNHRVLDVDATIELIGDEICVLRTGKKNYHLIIIE